MGNTVSGADRLPMRTKLAFGAGSVAEAMVTYSVTSFAMLYYNQVLGLPAWMAGAALSVSLVIDGFTDLLMGSISDRTRSRLGRRHPYMYAAPIPIALALVAVFNPPKDLSTPALFAWFAVSVILLRQVMNVFHTPHFALGGELSRDYHERSKVMAYASFSMALGSAAQSWIALTFFFKATPDYPRGLLNPAPWSSYALVMAAVACVILYASSWFTRDRIPSLPQPPADQPKFSLGEFYRDVAKAFSNPNYLLLILGYFFLTMMLGVRFGLSLYTNTFFWGLKSEDIRWITLGGTAGFTIAFLIAERLHRRFDKKPVIIAMAAVQAVTPTLPILLGLAGILHAGAPGLVPFLIVTAMVYSTAYGALTISVTSAMADIADENELKYGLRQEGVMYAMRNLFGKVDQGVGAALAGLILTLIAFPIKAQPGQVAHDVVVKLALSDGVLAAIPGLLAVVPYLFYRINRASFETTRAALAARAAQAEVNPLARVAS